MTSLATADLHDLLAQALADAATETRRMGDVPDGHWDDKARALVARLQPLTAAQSVPLVVSPGSTMTRPDVPLRTLPETWGA